MQCAVIEVSHVGTILSWPESARALFGLKPADTMGKDWVSVVASTREARRAELRKGFGALSHFNMECVKSGGATFPAEVTAIPSRGEGNSVHLSFRDNSEIQRLKEDAQDKEKSIEELRRSAYFLESLLENIPDMIFVKDAKDLRFVRFNRAGEELLGYSKQELLGKTDYDLFPRQESEFFTSKDRTVLSSGIPLEIAEEPIHTRARGIRVLHTKKVPVYDKSGTPSYLLGISEDITELKFAQAMARKASRMREDLLQVVSHDLKNLMGVIGLNLKLVQRQLGRDHQEVLSVLEGPLERMEFATQAMFSLVEGILDIARIESGNLKVKPQPLSSAGLIEQAIHLFAALAAEKSIDLRMDLRFPEITVLGDRDRLLQVFSNLISNSIKFTREGGKVEVILEQVGIEARFCVKDTGRGIRTEDLPNIFERFWQSEGAPKGGLGLGLAISRGIVEAHGGRIWAESTEGVGTSVYFTVPVYRQR